MKLAILGSDLEVLRLARAAVEEGHSIALIADIRAEDADAIAQIAPGLLDSSAEWELVLDRGVTDAVIVGRGAASEDLRSEQLKRLASEAMAMLVVHPACESVLPYYEVDMARREMGGIVQHFNPVAGHPVLDQLAAWVREGHPEIGPIHQVTCERRVADNSRANVLHWLARDVECLGVVAGDLQRVSAIGPRPDQSSYASLQVQTTCAGPATLRWAVGTPARSPGEAAITLVGDRGTVTLLAREHGHADNSAKWQLALQTAGDRQELPVETWDAAKQSIHRLDKAMREPTAERRDAMSTWSDATHAMEVVDAIELSLEKGRTLDVQQQQLTDRLAFRGTMSALGCGLLVLGFVVFVAVSLFGTAEGQERPLLISSWPLVLLALLAMFLLLQLAPLFVTKKRKKAAGANSKE